MRVVDVTATLAAFERRGPGTDAERRAARRLARELTAAGYGVTTEPFWGRPNWALAQAWHVALALAGSLLSVSHPTLGAALLALALLCVLADGLTGVSPGRRLTPERASQNVVARRGAGASNGTPPQTKLIVTAKYDVPRAALVYRRTLRSAAAALKNLTGPLALGWLAWLSLTIVWTLAVAIVRATGHHSSQILGAIQLPPTVALVLALALLLEAASAGYRADVGDGGSSAAVAVALTGAVAAIPPRNLAVELVLQGAGEGHEIGMRRYLKARRRELKQTGAVVLGITTTGAGATVWWQSDGRLIPIRYTRRLRELADTAAEGLADPWRGRGGTPALPARMRGLAAIAIGNSDPPGHENDADLDRLQAFALRLVDAIDAELEPEPAADHKAATPA